MRHVRFTIGGALLLVVALAVGIAALREATDLWDSSVFTATLGVLTASVLLAVHRRGGRRTYWLGFALFGWPYLVASLVPPVESRLLTTRGLAYLDSKVADRSVAFTLSVTTPGGPSNTSFALRALAFSPDGRTLAAKQGGAVRLWSAATGRLLAGPGGTTENFVRIGHSLLALVAGVFGGRLSRWLCSPGEPGRAEGSDVPPTSTPTADKT